MNENTHPLKLVSQKVLEDWAMMLVDEVKPSTQIFELEQPIFMSWIDIHGAVNGAISIIAQEPFLNMLATNLLGGDDGDEIGEEERNDAFREMGNVLAGNFLTEAYGCDVVFDLIQPRVSKISLEELAKFMQRKVIFGFSADDAPIAVTFSIKG